MRAIETLRKYGVGSRRHPASGCHGTIANLLGTEASIFYSQAFSTIPGVISAFEKRGDVVVSNRNIDAGTQESLQISRSTVRWFDYYDLKSLGDVLLSVEKERRKAADLL
ncbi:hypothetical protein EDB84DRAFT_1438705 [Lactarius hengduanensis]|nr:hypothetical protein EDB84DRAFT_1438705 [Lactarius hengduanensis]